jgi:hypothetical protein
VSYHVLDVAAAAAAPASMAPALQHLLAHVPGVPTPEAIEAALQVGVLGDAESSLGDAESSLGDAESSG